MTVRVIHGDMREQLLALLAEGVRVHSIVTDPPYGLAFMGKHWDAADNVAFQYETWRLCFDLLPPGGHLLAFAGTRTYHRMAVAIEEAGFEMRDTIAWLYGSGFPKSHNVSKGIDKAAGAEREVIGQRNTAKGNGGNGNDFLTEKSRAAILDVTAPATDAARQWDGWGTALKPAMELICVARKPLSETVAQTVMAHGTGALNIDGCRVGTEGATTRSAQTAYGASGWRTGHEIVELQAGRWPANVCHDGSAEVVKAFPETQTGSVKPYTRSTDAGIYGLGMAAKGKPVTGSHDGDFGSAARFFYSSKADADDRLGSLHPTVKPVDLMRWLVRLVTPPGGTCLDPFAGSGTTGMACMAEGFDCILIEREAEYVADIKARIAHVHGDDTPLFAVAAE
jgi:site-specific DNA-methyltransferase (adenine-specific)